MIKKLLCSALLVVLYITSNAQHSIAREWNELLLESIRKDYARPTVHARNLFHISLAMYDAWAAFNTEAETFFLGKTLGDYTCNYQGITAPNNSYNAQKEAISYATYRILSHRFQNSPNADYLQQAYDDFMIELGYEISIESRDYSNGSAAALGNYIASEIIEFGLTDGANEENGYDNEYYQPVNESLIIDLAGNPRMVEPNRWQPLTLEAFIDQSGNAFPIATPDFLSPEWGQVVPFSLKEEDASIFERDGFDYNVYHNPGPPSYIQNSNDIDGIEDPYKWGFALVSVWSSHLDPSDGVMIDISPASIGNIQEFPNDFESYKAFYNLEFGGDASIGHDINPHTGNVYSEQMVPRADYARVLAEFWADGPDSETPPGHWFTILNYVNDHPDLEKRFNGKGPILDDLEWDVKSYLLMGGTMHDVAISAWGIKGYYDYTRPISAIRYMADKGQSSNPNLSNYHPEGIPLIPNFIEVVEADDPLAFNQLNNVGKIKLYAWKGPSYIFDPDSDVAGVDWILAENWMPYQRPSFVTPPFAGYVSGHSTYSRAAAELMTLLTGDAFFPGGMGTFDANQNEFLVFEDGPSENLILQWATYRDASDQCSLSRIWGGIHPPIDDIPGRLIGEQIGVEAFYFAASYFYKDTDGDGFLAFEDCDDTNPNVYPNAPEIIGNGIDEDCTGNDVISEILVYPNPIQDEITLYNTISSKVQIQIFNAFGATVYNKSLQLQEYLSTLDLPDLKTGTYILLIQDEEEKILLQEKLIKL
ncbi:hypothetical protein KH5_03710 [Urechidicola sp. KH5]